MPGLGQTRAYLALIVIAVLWASYPALAKLAMRDFPPFFLALVRCVVASAFLSVMLVRSTGESVRELPPGAARAFLVLGVAGVWMSMQFTYVGIYYTTAANNVILQAATPVTVALAARLVLREHLGRRQWLGAAVSGAGVVLVITNGRVATVRATEIHSGDLITLFAICGWTAYTVYGKRVLALSSPVMATTGAYVLGTLTLVPTAIVAAPFYPAPRLASPLAWTVVFYQAILGGIAHVWWYRAVNVVGPSRSAIFMNIQPVVGVALAWLLLSESFGPWRMVGGALILGGVALTTWTRGRA